MKTLPINASKEDIINLLIEWTELLSKENYIDAFNLFPSYDGDFNWTPELLESAVFTYGCPGLTREEAEIRFGSADYKITSFLENPHQDEIMKSIEFHYFTVTPEIAQKQCLLNTDYENIIGDIHYFNVPLNGELSDLTARFYIKKVGEHSMTLSFKDLHVM